MSALASSPHTRGLLERCFPALPLDSIIPAHAGFTVYSWDGGWRFRHHPRTRGVYPPGTSSWSPTPASSPHTRGLPRKGAHHTKAGGIIPAHAGFTSHPHAGPCQPRASSPHTRGLPYPGPTHGGPGGIIPAHAGFTGGRLGRLWARRHHPRTRGVYSARPRASTSTCASSPHTRGLRLRLPGPDPGRPHHPRTRGVYRHTHLSDHAHPASSPHTRGLLTQRHHPDPPARIIPAHAGFTRRSAGSRCQPRHHPRTRGVYRSRACGSRAICASSPHTRGLRRPAGRGHEPGGIIPAHAGFTPTRPSAPSPSPHHPRTRGVYHLAALKEERTARIIPAHAGFTPRGHASRRQRPHHPRTRGVYPGSGCHSSWGSGSSPHTRGLRHVLVPHPQHDGIIPAHAGFTSSPIIIVGWRWDHPRTRGVY